MVHREAVPGQGGAEGVRVRRAGNQVQGKARLDGTSPAVLRYAEKFEDEYQPFGIGLNDLDKTLAGDLHARDAASAAAIRLNGLRRGDGGSAAKNSDISGLFRIWQTAIVRKRGLPIFEREVFRLKDGNQRITDAIAPKLGDRVRLG